MGGQGRLPAANLWAYAMQRWLVLHTAGRTRIERAPVAPWWSVLAELDGFEADPDHYVANALTEEAFARERSNRSRRGGHAPKVALRTQRLLASSRGGCRCGCRPGEHGGIAGVFFETVGDPAAVPAVREEAIVRIACVVSD